MTKDPYLKNIFSEPPMVAYKRPKSLKDMLVKAKIPTPPNRKSKRVLCGMKKCLSCTICPFVEEGHKVKSSNSSFICDINKPVTCNTENVIYAISCKKCNEQYIGQTGRQFKQRMQEHLGYIRNKKMTEPTGKHFNQPGHNISMFSCSILEKCQIGSKTYRETKEEHFIKLFQTKFKGMNKKL